MSEKGEQIPKKLKPKISATWVDEKGDDRLERRAKAEKKPDELSAPEAGVCPECLEVPLYCKCPVENPVCKNCLRTKTECICLGADQRRIDFWAA